MKLIVFADTNVFLDAFLGRTSGGDCIAILELAQEKKIKLFTAAFCLLTVMYFLKKDGMSRNDIRMIIAKLFAFVSLAAPTEGTFTDALLTDFNDLEDAVQYHTALDIRGIDYFITSNVKDYKKAIPALPVLSPRQFILQYEGKRR